MRKYQKDSCLELMTLLVRTFASKRVGASGGISMASQPNSEFLIMLAELHSAAVTFGMHFGRNVKNLCRNYQWRIKPRASSSPCMPSCINLHHACIWSASRRTQELGPWRSPWQSCLAALAYSKQMQSELLNIEFLTMPAELHSAPGTFGRHFPKKCEGPLETLLVMSRARSRFLAIRAELHKLASCVPQVRQHSHT